MPKLMNKSASIIGQTVSSFGYSSKRAEELTETEYTIVDTEIDVSPSTSDFLPDLTKALETVSQALLKSPRAKQLLARVQTFSEILTEAHGFVPLSDIIEEDKANNSFKMLMNYNLSCTGGGTALNDAALSGVEALEGEGARLYALDFGVNALGITITDGENNSSKVARNPQRIKEAIARARKAEKLESLKMILIGVGTPDANDPLQPDSRTKQYLENFAEEAGYDQFVWIGAATPKNIADLAGFISKSVVSSSQALGTGGASQNLTF